MELTYQLAKTQNNNLKFTTKLTIVFVNKYHNFFVQFNLESDELRNIKIKNLKKIIHFGITRGMRLISTFQNCRKGGVVLEL